MLNYSLAGKQTSSIPAISFSFSCMQTTLTSLWLISFRIKHMASSKIFCLLLFLHLNTWLSGFLFCFAFWSPRIPIPLFTSFAFPCFMVIISRSFMCYPSLLKWALPLWWPVLLLQQQTQHWESPTFDLIFLLYDCIYCQKGATPGLPQLCFGVKWWS